MYEAEHQNASLYGKLVRCVHKELSDYLDEVSRTVDGDSRNVVYSKRHIKVSADGKTIMKLFGKSLDKVAETMMNV